MEQIVTIPNDEKIAAVIRRALEENGYSVTELNCEVFADATHRRFFMLKQY